MSITQNKGQINDRETKPEITFTDVCGEKRVVPNGRFIDFSLSDDGQNPAGFTATPMSAVSVEDNPNPIATTRFSPRRKG